jgi:hypothetical protein
LLVGCGAKSEAKAPAPASVAPAPLPAEEPPDLSPVARPAEVVVVARIARPRAFVETLTQWSNLPLKLEDLLPEQARNVAPAVMWEAPIEAVLALDAFGEGKFPPPLIVGSIGLKSLEAGLSAADAMQMPTRRVAPGVYRFGDFGSASCAMAAAVGQAPARLVCADGVKDVDTLLPYVTRGLPREPQTGADFELTASAKPLQDRYGHDVTGLRLLAGVALREAALDVPRFDRALSDAIYGSVDEVINLFGDLEQVRLEARLDTARSALLGSAELRLKGDTSWVAGTLSANKAAPIPQGLPRIPPGSTMAAYAAGMPAERYAAIARIGGELAEGFLEHEKLPDGTRKRVRRVIDGWFSKLPESVMFVVSPEQKDSASYLRSDTTVTRASEPPPRILGAYSDMFALLADPALKRWAKQKFEIDEKAWPKTIKKALKLPGFKAPATVWETTVNLKALATADPKITRAIEHAVTAVDPNQPARLTILVQPDGDFTYVLSGDDVREMTRVMAEHKKSEPGLSLVKPARSDKVTMAGFITLGFIARYIERLSKQPDVGKAVANAPSRGQTPLPFATTLGPGSARFDIELPAAAFGDTSAAAMRAAGPLKSAFDKH